MICGLKMLCCVILIFILIWCVTETATSAISSPKDQLQQHLQSWTNLRNKQQGLSKRNGSEKRDFDQELRGQSSEENAHWQCCPIRKMWIQPRGGISLSGRIFELYPGQRFQQISCQSEFRDKPCRYIKDDFTKYSRCIQLYSYSYAIVKEFDEPEDAWRLDYIKVRSGCSCILTSPYGKSEQ